MTNLEKFERTFGYTPDIENSPVSCLIPQEVCSQYKKCIKCPFNGWWNKEYNEQLEVTEE